MERLQRHKGSAALVRTHVDRGLKDRRIRVNAIINSPGVIETPGLTELLRPTKQTIETLSDGVPFGRIGAPDEIAKAVVFLASDDSSYVTGAEFFVDGGV